MDGDTAKAQARPGGRAAIVEALFDLFRRAGFEGVSISDVSRATGLGKSSLYHHFPGGKADMADAVLASLAEAAEGALFAPLAAPGSRAARVDAMLAAVDGFYGGGLRPCLIASMLVGSDGGATRPPLRSFVARWLAALATALEQTGATQAAAEAAATDALTRIQGALVLSRALADPGPFRAALAAIRRDLLAA